MPRLGQLLSALLIALIGVLIVQMFLLAGMYLRMAVDHPRVPVVPDTMTLRALAADPVLTAALGTADPALDAIAAQHTLVIIITPALPTPATKEPDGGKALIERFINLTGDPIGSISPYREAIS